MEKLLRFLLALVVVAATVPGSMAQTKKYVKPVATGTGDGSTWQNASGNLKAIIDGAATNTEIWVAKGTYYPTTTADRSISFALKDGVAIFGGFAGTETLRTERNWQTNITTLSGDIGVANSLNDNSYNVVTSNNVGNTAILDGFTITNGVASTGEFVGGGLYSLNSSCAIHNCRFFFNISLSKGAAIYFNGGNPSVVSCSFVQNQTSNDGGVIYNQATKLLLINSSFTGNDFIALYSTKPCDVVNCSFSGNYRDVTITNSGGASMNITNSIIWGNQGGIQNDVGSSLDVSYSIVQGAAVYPGQSNLLANPMFVQQPPIAIGSTGNLRLQDGSPAMNKGNNGANTQPTDLDGKARIVYGTIDMGAYEKQIPCPAGVALFVNAAAAAGGDGTTWLKAFNNLQDALANPCAGVSQIWVAKGTYYPDEGGSKSDNDRNASFIMRNNLAIYGGFAGGETSLDQRNWKTNPTILSGDINKDGTLTANSYHVIYNDIVGTGLNNSAVLDGFTITGGNANGSNNNTKYGGGLYNYNCSPSITNCSFVNNSVTLGGGGIYNNLSAPRVTNCSFAKNTAAEGGAIYNNNNSSPAITNCSISNNSASSNGGGMYNNSNTSPSITNSIIWGNTGGQVVNNGGTPAISYSIVQNGYTGTGNLDTDPLFVDAAAGNLRLLAGSPAINNGLNSANTNPTDLDGNPRIVGGTIDRGAYETSVGCPPSGILYVDSAASLGGDGSSWTKAFTNLQDALANSCATVTQIWVAKGTYYPDEGGGNADNDRNAAFIMRNNLAIYGGFAGTEAANFQLSQRDFAGNPSILSADIDKNGVRDDGNSYHVVYNEKPGTGLNNSAVLNGFTITAGNANGAGNAAYGGGMFNYNSSPSITNCSFVNNHAGNPNEPSGGGGIYNNSSLPVITNCSFANNSANGGQDNGGGILNNSSSPSIINCSFTGNSASNGGGMYNKSSFRLTITNCSFAGNSASNGGGMYNFQSDPNITNCSFSGNSGGGIYNNGPSLLSITNCIIWGNTGGQAFNPFITITYSIIQGGYSGTGNLDIDPLFVDAANGNLRLQLASPAINKGLNSANTLATDLDGNPRIVNGTIDMGAYESQVICPTSGILYVNATATGAKNGINWTDAYTNLQDALANACPGVTQIWVAKGTYYPDEGGGKSDNSPNTSFTLKNNLAIYGGFAGGETSLDQRNWKTNPTILSGDINKDGTSTGNSYHVIYNDIVGTGLNNSAVLDGFTITAGNANGSNNTDKYGGGLYNYNCSPSITNCSFVNNSVTIGGGSLYNSLSSPRVINCSFTKNTAQQGGAVYNNSNSSPTITNCSFSNNTASGIGGGILNNSSSPSIINCSFSGNSALSGGGIYNSQLITTITNSIIWGNTGGQVFNYGVTPTITYSIVEGGFSGTGNLDTDPLFVDAANGNLRLQACSPAINVGSDAANSTATDLDDNSRKFGTIDMGAYERQTAKPTTWYLDITATGNGDGSSWANAFTSLPTALQQLKTCATSNTLQIAKGTYTGAQPFEMDKLNAIILGGYPSGGGNRNPNTNPVIIQGEVKVLQSLRVDGVTVKKP